MCDVGEGEGARAGQSVRWCGECVIGRARKYLYLGRSSVRCGGESVKAETSVSVSVPGTGTVLGSGLSGECVDWGCTR